GARRDRPGPAGEGARVPQAVRARVLRELRGFRGRARPRSGRRLRRVDRRAERGGAREPPGGLRADAPALPATHGRPARRSASRHEFAGSLDTRRRFRYPSAPAFAAVSELPAQALIDLVRSRQFEELESAWQRAAEAPGPVDAYCGVVEALCDADMASRALGLAANMVEALARLGRAGEARRLAATTVRRGAHNEAMARRLLELTEQVFASEPW